MMEYELLSIKKTKGHHLVWYLKSRIPLSKFHAEQFERGSFHNGRNMPKAYLHRWGIFCGMAENAMDGKKRP